MPQENLSLKDITGLMIKHFGHHEGLFEAALQINIAVGQIGPTIDQVLPGAMFGISGASLIKVEKLGPNTVDAAVANPPAKQAAKKAAQKRVAAT